MGLLNIPSPVFKAVNDAVTPVLPPALRIAFWAVILAVGTMLLYKVLSPQERIGQAKRRARAARQKLNHFDGEFAEAWPLIRNQFATAFKHIGLVVPGTIVAVLPLLCFLVWADNYFGHQLPQSGQVPVISTMPRNARGMNAHWDANGNPPAVVIHHAGQINRFYPMIAPVTAITKHSTWNWLVGDPLGYLPDNSPIQAVHIRLPRREYIQFGPSWARGWLAVFIPVMFIVSLLMFKWAKVE